MSLYVDLTEFLKNPIKSGIQRIVGEFCKHLPADSAIPVRLHAGQYLALPRELIGTIGEHFADGGGCALAKIRQLSGPENATLADVSPEDTVLVPEVFLDQQRVAFFCSMPAWKWRRCRFIVYDLLALTNPGYFSREMTDALPGYFHLVRQAEHCAFISEHTRDVYYRRLKRTQAQDGVILPLGCDSFGIRPDKAALDRPLTFTVIGTIEPRKNHTLILDAFEPLLRQTDELRLSFIGNMAWVAPEIAQRIRMLANDKESGFQFHPAPDDNAIRNHIEQSRATIYVSAAEGYGLPPVESLWCGTPVIASAAIPSLQRLGTAGIHYVEPLTAANIRQAVLDFLDNDYANQKAKETLQLNLPSWNSFTERVLAWCEQETG